MSLLTCEAFPNPSPVSKLKIEDWGMIAYAEALRRQEDLVNRISVGEEADHLIFCTHPPVVTLGRSKHATEDLQGWQGETVEVSRGGRATYHGPNQLLIYPILNLNEPKPGFPTRDLHAYLRFLENVIVQTLKSFNVAAEAKTLTQMGARGESLSLTGVWVNEKKIASIGVAVRKWVTFHGVALNIDYDPQAFTGLRPCGFSNEIMTSLEEVNGQKTDRQQVLQKITAIWNSTLL